MRWDLPASDHRGGSVRRHVYYYTLLEGQRTAAALLRKDPGCWLPRPAEPCDGAWQVALTAAGSLPALLDEHLALVTVGEVTGADTLTRPVTWRSASAGRLVPVLEADLELEQLTETAAHLSLLGTYRPPLSVAGGLGDRLLGHRVAEACVRRFVLDVAERLGQSPAIARPR